MECPVCHNQMHNKKVQHFQVWEEHYILFDNVPATVCAVCGETLYSGEVVDKINRSLWKHDKPLKKAELEIYSLSS